MPAGVVLSRALAVAGLLLCGFLTPIVTHAAALREGTEPEWIASLSGLHGWASAVAPSSVYRSFGLITPLVYLLLLGALCVSRAPGTRLLRWVLVVAAVVDAFAYALPSGLDALPGTIEFICLPLLLAGVGVAAWHQRCNGPWLWIVCLGIPLAAAGLALVQYWPHGALLGVAVAIVALAWAPATTQPSRP